MLKFFLGTALLMTSVLSFGQTAIKIFYNENDTRVYRGKGSYYRVGKFKTFTHSPGIVDTLFVDSARTYYAETDKLRSKEFFNERGYLHGDYVEYYDNGHMKVRGTYNEGRRSRYSYGFYPNGKTHHIFFYAAGEADAYQTNRRIFAYWDSLGTQLVKDGQGFCKCYLSSGSNEMLREEGQVASGLRVAEWNFYEDGKLVNKELFENGRFVSGVAYNKLGEFPYTLFEMQPEFKGGLQALAMFISKTLHYPMSARRMGIEGQSFVSFVIEKDGSVSEITTVHGISDDIDTEARRVIAASNKLWTPALQRGHPKRSKFVLPIRFKLEN
jgi:TonB family protein